MVDLIYRTTKGLRNYRNPLSIACRRLLRSHFINVVDRRTGLRFRCRRGADVMMAETLHAHIYDLEFAPLRAGDVVFDIGANHGFYSCWAAFQGATVHAFEPDHDSVELLQYNIRANGLENKIHVHPLAIAASSGKANLFCSPQLGGGMNTIIPEFAEKAGVDITSFSRVNTITLADALAHCNVTRLRTCKLDCEGAELSILQAMESETREKIEAFVMEFHPEAYELSQLMGLLLGWDGYHVSKVRSHEVANANLAVVRSDLIKQWSGETEPGDRAPSQVPSERDE